MKGVLKLEPRRTDADVVQVLEVALEKARSGDLVSVLLIQEFPDGQQVSWAGTADVVKMLGLMEYTKLRWIIARPEEDL